MQVKVNTGGHTYHGNFTLTQYMSKLDPTVPALGALYERRQLT
jgi:hypothetical protein